MSGSLCTSRCAKSLARLFLNSCFPYVGYSQLVLHVCHNPPLVAISLGFCDTLQASKTDQQQASIGSYLLPFNVTTTADVAVIGCGPAGLTLAAELAKNGVNVALIGRSCSSDIRNCAAQ